MRKRLIVFNFLILFCFCGNKESSISENYQATIFYYHFGLDDKGQEIINVNKLNRPDSLTFTYTYKQLQEEKDKLVIYDDSICYNNVKLKFLDKRKFKIDSKEIEVEKYLCRGEGYSQHLYIEKSYGLRLCRNRWNDIVVEYQVNQIDTDVNKRIVNDDVFFNKG